jgi:hypothetical protein
MRCILLATIISLDLAASVQTASSQPAAGAAIDVAARSPWRSA